MKTPDVTIAQIVAVVGSAIAVAVAFGVPISQDASDAIIQLVTVLAPILLVADAAIRHGRSRALAPPAPAPAIVPTVELAAEKDAPEPSASGAGQVVYYSGREAQQEQPVTPYDRPGI